MDSYHLLVLEFLGPFLGVTGLIMRSVELKLNIIFPNAHSAPCSARAAKSHWVLVNSYGFIRLMKVFWFVRAEQGHKSAGDNQFIRMLLWLVVQVY